MRVQILHCLAFTALSAGCSVALIDDEAPLLGPEPEPPKTSAASQSGAIKLATWNLQWLNRQEGEGPVPRDAEAYARLARYAERLDADIVALQEVDGPEAAGRIFNPEAYSFHFAAQASTQRVGFAYKHEFDVTLEPDYAALDLGGLRRGVVMTALISGWEVEVLAVHLKSGCFEASLTMPSSDCLALGEQQELLETWIDARSNAGAPFVVLGDFNRRLFATANDEFWIALDDGEPAGLRLLAPTSEGKAQCWDGEYPDFIDHVVLAGAASEWVGPEALEELVYDPVDEPFRAVLSDHCPLAVTLTPGL